MRKLSLFSGIGGIDLAAEWAGMETVAFCEREAFPQKVLRKHWPDVPIYDDVCTLTAERLKEDGIIGPGRTIDIVSAGYPCQPESTAGKRRGKEDDRWLWPEVRRIIKEIRPRWFIGENVFGHVSLGLDIVLSDLEDDDYTVEAIVIPAVAVGAPHRRDRVIVVANSSGGERRSRSQIEGILRALSENGAEYSDVDGSSTTQSRGDVAHSTSVGQPRQGESLQSCNSAESREGEASKSINVCLGKERTIESVLGGVLDGLSDWLDGHRWPAGLGQEQYDWEPPRVATGVKDRAPRLKALGNAVNPYQVYPILAAIKHINDLIDRGEGI